jgi:hypothetical protein
MLAEYPVFGFEVSPERLFKIVNPPNYASAQKSFFRLALPASSIEGVPAFPVQPKTISLPPGFRQPVDVARRSA